MPRKAVEGGSGKRFPLNMKTTLAVRSRLEAAAAESGRSLTAEVEYRLERSFDLPAFAEDVASQVVRKLKGTADG
jgi:hypothetical protein